MKNGDASLCFPIGRGCDIRVVPFQLLPIAWHIVHGQVEVPEDSRIHQNQLNQLNQCYGQNMVSMKDFGQWVVINPSWWIDDPQINGRKKTRSFDHGMRSQITSPDIMIILDHLDHLNHLDHLDHPFPI